jgi:nicotinamidase-related amidase
MYNQRSIKREATSMIGNDPPSRNLITRDDCTFVVVDVQGRLMPVIADKEKVIDNVVRLLKFAEVIGLPVILTEQENLGATLPEIRDLIPDTRPIPKLVFNCFRSDEFEQAVQETGRNTLILTGVETHICVAQTALHALPQFTVHVVSDATSSRTVENCNIGLQRMRQAGAVITSTEMLIFELLQRAGTDEFRATLPLVK